MDRRLYQVYVDIRGQSIPEPKELQEEIFYPVDPTHIYRLLWILQTKYLLTPVIFLYLLFQNLSGTPLSTSIFGQVYGFSFLLDIGLLIFFFQSSTYKLDVSRLNQFQRFGGVVLLLGMISGYLFVLQGTLGMNTELREYVISGLYIMELLFFLVIRAQLIKLTDRSQSISSLSGTIRTVLVIFVFNFTLIFFMIQQNVALWEVHFILFILLLSYLVFVNLWISGPNEYMDRESMYRLTSLSVLLGLVLLLSSFAGLVFPLDDSAGVFTNAQSIYLFMAPILMFNLFGKYRGYLFRNRRIIRGAKMLVDEDLES